MVYEFRFPDVGEGIAEGEIKKWRIKEGEQVKEHDILAEVETDKAVVEIPSPQSGNILKIYHREGEKIKVGEVMAVIGAKGEPIPAKPAPAPVRMERKEFAAVVGVIPEAREGELLATPATRKLAQELGVDISKVKGTGPGGRIIEADVRAASTAPKAPTVKLKYDFYGTFDRIPLKGVRLAVAKKMMDAVHKAAPVTAMDDADITELVALRNREKEKAKAKGIKLTYLSFIVRAVVEALKSHPYMNSMIDEENQEVLLKKYYNIGIAVATQDGLIVPVIKRADQKDLYSIANEIEELANKTRNRTIDLADLRGGTFTITNYGSIGGIYGTPAMNYPEAAILGVGKILERPAVVDGKIQIRSILPLSLTFDHRILDGAEASAFLNTLMEVLAKPEKLL